MSGELVAAGIGALIIGGSGLGFVWLGRRMAAGRIHPNMGYQNAQNTTPESWRATQSATGKAIVTCGWSWVVAGLFVAIFVPVGVGLLLASSAWLVIQVARASKHLETTWP